MAFRKIWGCDYCGRVIFFEGENSSGGNQWLIKISSNRFQEGFEEDPLPQSLYFCDMDCASLWISFKRPQEKSSDATKTTDTE